MPSLVNMRAVVESRDPYAPDLGVGTRVIIERENFPRVFVRGETVGIARWWWVQLSCLVVVL